MKGYIYEYDHKTLNCTKRTEEIEKRLTPERPIRSKQSDHQHQQELTDTEKEPTLMIECTANEGIHRINMEINHTMRQKKKIYVRPTIYEVKHATCKRKKT